MYVVSYPLQVKEIKTNIGTKIKAQDKEESDLYMYYRPRGTRSRQQHFPCSSAELPDSQSCSLRENISYLTHLHKFISFQYRMIHTYVYINTDIHIYILSSKRKQCILLSLTNFKITSKLWLAFLVMRWILKIFNLVLLFQYIFTASDLQ